MAGSREARRRRRRGAARRLWQTAPGPDRSVRLVQRDPSHGHRVALTSEIRSAPQFRITVEPSPDNGLRLVSQVMVDKPMTFRRDKIRAPFGRLDDETMLRVGRALAVWFGIA